MNSSVQGTPTQTRIAKEVAEQGFSIISGLFDPTELANILAGVEHSAETPTQAGVRHALGFPEIYALAQDKRLLQLASDIEGDEPIPYRATLFDKSPAANWLVTWHQDKVLPLCSRHDQPGWGPWSHKQGVLYAQAPAAVLSNILALRIHFDDSEETNGPLRVLPSTHKLGVLSDERINALAHSMKDITCCVETGGVLAMRPLIVHASSKTHLRLRRRVLHIEYSTSLKTEDGLELRSEWHTRRT